MEAPGMDMMGDEPEEAPRGEPEPPAQAAPEAAPAEAPPADAPAAGGEEAKAEEAPAADMEGEKPAE